VAPGGAPRKLRLPFPGLVFVCLPARQAPHVFAAKERPRAPDAQLFHCPAFNVFKSGRVCVGSHAFPADPARVPEAFFESHFSAAGDTAGGKSQRHPDDIGKLWRELDGRERYPLDDLVAQLTVADAMNIGE
jgi:PRTRC genetic system protein B